MLTVRLLVIVVLGIILEINAEKVDLNAIFETPKKNYDDLEILERSTFEADEPKPPGQPTNCIRDEPKAIANAQVLLTFPAERSQNHLPIIETRNFVGPDVLCPQSSLASLYPYHYPPIYPPHLSDPYYFPKDPYYPHLPPYGYNPPYPRIPPSLSSSNSIPKGNECPQITTTPTSICTSSKPATTSPCQPKEICCIYEDLLAIIEKMVQYLLQGSPSCNIKFSDHEKLKIGEALNIIIKYLNMKCRNVNTDIQLCRNQELNVEVSLILEDILSMLPITLLQSKCGKLELNNHLHCLLNIVKHIRETYGHIRGLCSIYKNLKDMFKPCIFVKDCKSNNYLSKENIRGYLLMDSLNLALYLVYKNNINENLAEKKHEIVDMWVDYLYKTQFLNCNEVCPARVPLLNDVKSTEELLTKLRKLFLYEYVLRLREKDPCLQGLDSIISFCTTNCTCTFGNKGDCKITGLKCELDKNKITLEELLSLVENHLKGKYNFKPATECTPCCIDSSIPLKLTVNEDSIKENIPIYPRPCGSINVDPEAQICSESLPNLSPSQSNLYPEAPMCPKPVYSPPNLGEEAPICSEPNLGPHPPICPETSPNLRPEAPIYSKPVDLTLNLGPEAPICYKPINLSPEAPICSKPVDLTPNLGPEAPICYKPINLGPEAPICSKPLDLTPNLGPEAPICYKPINFGPEAPICSKPVDLTPNLGPEAPICYKPINLGPEAPICSKPVDLTPNLGPEAPICFKPINLGHNTPICREPPERLPNHGLEAHICFKPRRPKRPHPPNYPRPPCQVDLGPEAPICLDLPTSSNLNLSTSLPQTSELNLGPQAPICPESLYTSPNLGPDGSICSKPQIRPNYPRPISEINLGQEAPICPHPCRRPIDSESFEDCDIISNNFGNCQKNLPICPSCQFHQIRNNCTTNLRPTRPLLCQPVDSTSSKSPDSIQASLAPTDLSCVVEDPVDLGHKLCNLDNMGIPVPNPSIEVTSAYCDECPLSKLHTDHLRRGYNILTSSEPIRCLSCGGGSGCRKFPLDMDAFNVYDPNVPEDDIGVAPNKEVGCRKPVPNGRRCPYCTPYFRELDY